MEGYEHVVIKEKNSINSIRAVLIHDIKYQRKWFDKIAIYQTQNLMMILPSKKQNFFCCT